MPPPYPGLTQFSLKTFHTGIFQSGTFISVPPETSKLTNDHTHKTKKEAVFSYNKGNFFGSMGFDLDANDPTMTFRCVTIEGKEVHSMTLKRSSLQR